MRHVPKQNGIKLTLYDILLNVNQVDETIEAEAQIDGKLIVLSSGEHISIHRYFYNDAYYFDFFRDDTFEQQATSKANTRVRIFNEGNRTEFNDYYAYVGKLDFLQLSWRFGKTWIQQKDNVMWLTNIILTITSVAIASLALKISLTPPSIQPLTLDKRQLQELIRELRADREAQATKNVTHPIQPVAPSHPSQEFHLSAGAKSHHAHPSSTRIPKQ